MPRNKKEQKSEVEKVNQRLGDALYMPIIQQPESPEGTTEFAKDKIKEK